MEAVLRLDQVRNLARRQAEGCLFEFRNGLSLSDPTQVTALVLRSRVFGVLLRQVFELSAFLDLLSNVLGLLLDLLYFCIRL